VKTPAAYWYRKNHLRLEFSAFGVLSHSCNLPRPSPQPPRKNTMMAVAAAQKNREMFAIKKSYSIEVSPYHIFQAIEVKWGSKRDTYLLATTKFRVISSRNLFTSSSQVCVVKLPSSPSFYGHSFPSVLLQKLYFVFINVAK
jgi:hypothetical protein